MSTERTWAVEVDWTDRSRTPAGFATRTRRASVAAWTENEATLVACQMTACLVPEDAMVVAARVVS